MKYVSFEYEDPTGGGDNLVVLAPEWVDDPPEKIRIEDVNGEVFHFDYIADADNGAEVDAPELQF